MLSRFVLKTTEQLQTKIKHSVSINHCLRHVLFGHFSMSLSLNSFFKDLFILSMLCLHACICIRYFLQKGSCLNATCVLVVAVLQALGVYDWRLKRGSHIGMSPLTGVIWQIVLELTGEKALVWVKGRQFIGWGCGSVVGSLPWYPYSYKEKPSMTSVPDK